MNEIKRGEIYYIEVPYTTGHEMEKDRPGVIVSCDELNRTSPVVTVVMCSASCQRDLPEHITIRSTPMQSTALCEHIYTVDKSRVSRYLGCCTPAELAAVDIGIAAGLGLGKIGLASAAEGTEGRRVPCYTPEKKTDEKSREKALAIARAEIERDTYKTLFEGLLDRMTMERRVG